MNQIQCILRKCIYSLPCIYFSIFILSTWICLGLYTENKLEWQWTVILIHTILLPVDLIFLYKIKEIAQARLPDLNWPCICCFILIWIPKIIICCIIGMLLIEAVILNPNIYFDNTFNFFCILHGLQMIFNFIFIIPIFGALFWLDYEDRLIEESAKNVKLHLPSPTTQEWLIK